MALLPINAFSPVHKSFKLNENIEGLIEAAGKPIK
jgi:hypothetical protein